MLTNPDYPFVPNYLLANQSLLGLLPNPQAAIHLDIGTGLGHFLVAMVQQHPQAGWIGLEYNSVVIKRAVRKIRRLELNNVLLFTLEARAFLLECVPPQSLDHIWLNFPDPWPKNRHADRRHTYPWMLGLLISRLKVGGEIHLATDAASYRDELGQGLTETGLVIAVTDTPWRRQSLAVQTKYERKWLAENRPLFYADWRKIQSVSTTGYPFEPQPAPQFLLNFLPERGLYSEGPYICKVFYPSHQVKTQAGFCLINRETGISTSGMFDAQTGVVLLKGPWTPWKVTLMEKVLHRREEGIQLR